MDSMLYALEKDDVNSFVSSVRSSSISLTKSSLLGRN